LASCEERIDFVFGIDSFAEVEFMKLKAEEFKIVKQERGKELSDHWPLSVHLLPK
jgi:endonuclease/exonuclease/phosphatase family metal-dependent hydrolase